MKWTEDRLRTWFKAKVREERRAEDLDPDIRPTHEWLRNHGYSGIEGFARRNDMTVTEVLEEICAFDPPTEKPLGVKDKQSRHLFEEWLEKEAELFNQWGTTRVSDAKSHIRKLAEVADDELGTTNFLHIVGADSSEQTRLLMRLFAKLASRLESEGAQSTYTRTLERWADYVALIGEIEDHKVGEVRDMMGYTFARRSPEHVLKPKQIRATWRATDDKLEYQALLVMLTAAGTRRAEPVDIEIDQLRLDRDDPYIVFDEERKTGAATVPIMAGVEIIEAWIEHLKKKDSWDGRWLFPSKKSKDGSRSPEWVNDIIGRMMKRAEITFPDGKEPTPKHFRSFWYNHYTSARQEWLRGLEDLAEEQGVSSAKIIDLHYLNGQHERDHFRKFSQSYFAAAFGEELVHRIEDAREVRDAESDEFIQRALNEYMDDIRANLRDTETDEDDMNYESSAVVELFSVWTRDRLCMEHSAAAESDQFKQYPPSPQRGMTLTIVLISWALMFGTVWGLTGTFTIDPISGDIHAAPSTVIGLTIGCLQIVADLPDL